MKTLISPNRRRFLLRGMLTGGGLCVLARTGSAGAMDMVMQGYGEGHRQAMPRKRDGYRRSQASYRVPDVGLVDIHGEAVALDDLLDGDRPVMMNFIFTTCGAICPVMSGTFAEVQAVLGAERHDLHMVSISVDPEYDTPAVLKAYAGHYGAEYGAWQMLTGRREDSIAVQRAFDAYYGSKSDLMPVTFLRGKSGQAWLRLEGFASAGDLVREYRMLAARAGA